MSATAIVPTSTTAPISAHLDTQVAAICDRFKDALGNVFACCQDYYKLTTDHPETKAVFRKKLGRGWDQMLYAAEMIGARLWYEGMFVVANPKPLARLPAPEQKRIIADGVEVATGKENEHVLLAWDDMSTTQRRQVLEDSGPQGRIRSCREQLAWLQGQKRLETFNEADLPYHCEKDCIVFRPHDKPLKIHRKDLLKMVAEIG
jgi:hypothetical protein